MTEKYTRPKTVRFDEDTYRRIVIAASMFDVTTSQYLRTRIENSVAKIKLEQVLPEASCA